MVEQRPFKPKVVGSIPTAPTNHLPDWSGLNKFARGQKGADKPCPSPKLYLHVEGLPTSALFGFAPGQTGSGTHVGSQFPGEQSPDRTIQTRPRALFTGFSSGDRALGSAVVTMMQSAKSLARSHASQRCGRNPAVWSSLAQSEMCPVLMIIVNIFRK